MVKKTCIVEITIRTSYEYDDEKETAYEAAERHYQAEGPRKTNFHEIVVVEDGLGADW